MRWVSNLARIQDEGTSQAIWGLRASSLRYILAFTAAGHFLWHTIFTAVSPFDTALRAWIIFPFVVGGEWASYRLLSRKSALASFFFVVWALLCCTSAIWLFQNNVALYLYPLIALVATITVHPLAGLIAAGAEATLVLVLMTVLPSGFLGETPVTAALLAAALTAVFAWTLVRNLIESIDRSLDSYEQAQRNMRDAREHRAKLVQALNQLDVAYYRLQGANASLAVAWRAAESAERAKAELVANISHELRTPLNLIVGFSEMMISAPETYGSKPLPPEYRTDLHAIYRSAQHLLDLTNDVLDLAQAEVNRLALVRDQTSLADIVREATGIVRDYIHAKGLRLNVVIAPDLPSMSLDRLRIRQVVLNLLTNAARFTQRGQVSVTVARAHDEVVIAVADTGPGVPPEKIDRLFEEFHHVDELAAREHLSTGLGLSISKRFIELHHGRMWVESTLGVGTTFWIALPIEEFAEDVVTDESNGDRLRGRRRRTEAVAQPTLVLADTNPSLLRLVQRRLDAYHVIPASDSQEAGPLAEDLKAMAIIADVATPLAATSTAVIRCSLQTKHAAARSLGVTDYLVEPVTHAELRAAIDRLGIPISRVLLTDDDLRAVRLLTRMLSDGGYELLSAHNGDEALATMRAARPDLVILDLAMPGRSGHDVLQEVRSDPSLSAIPIIVLSASPPDDSTIPISTEITITKVEGMTSQETLNVIESVLRVLSPPRAYLPASGAAPAEDRPGLMV